jgi:radical SAM superfamily enzyme YgiQ (UPF0313 family)
MWIKLISPAVTRRPMDSDWKTHMAPPLALLVLGALTPPRHRVTVVDENVQPLDRSDAPDLVGITVKADTFLRAARIAVDYRRRGIPVVMGGIHPTACPEECQLHSDAVVIGEAEYVWPELLQHVETGCLQRFYRNTRPVDPADTPVPRWELLDARRYLFTNTLTAGRGCPWRCSFCYNSSPNIDARYRMKPVSHVLREIESLGTRHVMFIDDNFIGDPGQARELLAALRPLNLTWHTAVSADIGRHEDLLDDMAASGCKSLFIGFETVRREALQGCRKGQNRPEEYDATIARIHARGMLVNASMVFGFDEDTPDIFPDTLNWLLRNRVASMTAHILTPYPGTLLHAQLAAEGRIFDRDYEHYNTAHAVFRPARMSATELEQGHRWMYRRFYSWEGIVRRWPTATAQVRAYLEFNLLYRKFGRPASLLGHLVGMRNLARLAKQVAYGGEPSHSVGRQLRGRQDAYGGRVTPALVEITGR